ncbi:MAG: putA [Acidimicrobiaceae bacterium]|nr:MAG: putA [Acidimicrobiaceae bacterium]
MVVDDPALRDLTFALTDEVLRFDDPRGAARRFAAIVGDIGVPRSLGLVDRVSLAVGAKVARVLPRLVMPMVRARMMREANGVVLSADDPAFADHVVRRRDQGFHLNVNVLGEAILSDAEADVRMAMLRERITCR